MVSLDLTRDGYYHDIFDEFVSVNSWSGKALVQDSPDIYLRVWLEVRVYGHVFRKRCRPRRWTARLKMSDFESEPVAMGDCKSLRDVRSQVKAIDLEGHVRAFLGRFYSRERATCVWIKRDYQSYRPNRYDTLSSDLIRTDSDFVPFASMFVPMSCSFNYWGNYMRASHISTGTYITLEPKCGRRYLVKISSYYSESGLPAGDEFISWTKS